LSFQLGKNKEQSNPREPRAKSNVCIARVRASLHRAAAPVANEAAMAVIEAGDFHVDLESCKLTVLGREIHLTPKEFDLLQSLQTFYDLLTHFLCAKP
jgi:hypothetical protein